MGFWKEAFKERIAIRVLAGGHIFTEKQVPVPIQSVSVMKGDEKGAIISQIPFGEKKTFSFERITWERSGERSAGKAAAGAIAGTIIAGPVGTIAGAAFGGKKKDTSTAYLYLRDQNDVTHEVHIECSKQQYTKLAALPF